MTIPRYCKKAEKCSYGKKRNPCDLCEDCPAFKVDTTKALEAFMSGKKKKIKGQGQQNNKYRNEKVEYNGMTFDSKLELKRYCELKVLEKAKQITELQRQVKFVLIDKTKDYRETSYLADFVYKDKDGKLVVEDCKSKITKTQVYKIKKKLMQQRYGIKIVEIERDE